MRWRLGLWLAALGACAGLCRAIPETPENGTRLLCDALVRRGADRANVARVSERLDGVDLASRAATLRELMLLHPVLQSSPILYVVRGQYAYDHHNTETLFHTGEPNNASYRPGGPIKVIALATGESRALVDPGPTGCARDPEVHFDGKRIVFSMRRDRSDNYHVFECDAAGGRPRQITSGQDVADIDPFYLPDGRIAFSSTRDRKYCMCNIHIMANLNRVNPDGSGLEQIGRNTLFEGHGSLLPDGRILYDRWEYVDRNFGDAQGLWAMNPDGTSHAVYFGNNTACPGAVIDARAVPGTCEVLCLFGACHDHPWGALALIDRRSDVDANADPRGPIRRIWPTDALRHVGRGNIDTFKIVRPRYEDPYPLDDAFFLCSRELGEQDRAAFPPDRIPGMGIYLVDRFGHEVLLHAEWPGCFDPMPLAPRLRPPTIPDRRKETGTEARVLVGNVYEGTHMAGMKRGEVKFLRVVESPEKRTWTVPAWGGQGVQRPAMNWHSFENKRILGTVPVEGDGSAYFAMPAGKFVFFQLLDEDQRMVASMRSGIAARPGETMGCTGCHESRRTAPPPTGATGRAWYREPSRLDGWMGPPRSFSFMGEVQPVFDRHCVSCHDFGQPAGEKLVLARDRDLFFSAAYTELWQGWMGPDARIRPVGAGPAAIQPALSWGSRASRLVHLLDAGHHDVRLTPDEMRRITTWIDLNAVYYPTYNSAYPNNLAGRSPLDPAQIRSLSELTGIDLAGMGRHDRLKGPLVSFDRPDMSPCLKGLNPDSDAYREALDLIRAGSLALADRPRGDVEEGFSACPVDLAREKAFVGTGVE